MSKHKRRRLKQQAKDRSVFILTILAAVSLLAYLAIAGLSRYFAYESPANEKPIPLVLALFAVAFVCYLIAIWVVRSTTSSSQASSGRLLKVIVAGAVIFRVVLLFSTPILEIDIYRYLWDGAVVGEGVSPFRYSPRQVKQENRQQPLPNDLSRLVALRNSSRGLADSLYRIHHAELTTIYPPVSQFVFAASHWTTPRQASVETRLTIMKLWLLVFDLATLALVVVLLKWAKLSPSLCVIYAWCPLLMKEVANSGHLDAIAVFLTTLAIVVASRVLFTSAERARPDATWKWTTASAILLGLAVGAKLYPIVLAPLLFISFLRRFGWRQTIVPAFALTVTVAVVLCPMMPRRRDASQNSPALQMASIDVPPLPPPETGQPPQSDPSLGLKTFLQNWEINDFLFLLIVENVRPTADMPRANVAWFTVTPESWREAVTGSVARHLNIDERRATFFIARAITALVFFALAIYLAWQASKAKALADWLRLAFLTLAWFWLLLPTQNPWYWTWALPLLVFARSRAWLLLGGLAMLYYLRFWLEAHWPGSPLPGTRYPGLQFFDFIVTWIEFAPWFVWLIAESVLRITERDSSRGDTDVEKVLDVRTVNPSSSRV